MMNGDIFDVYGEYDGEYEWSDILATYMEKYTRYSLSILLYWYKTLTHKYD